MSKYGTIDILVNNTGISESTPLANYTEETFDKVIDLNVKGVFNCSKIASHFLYHKYFGRLPVEGAQSNLLIKFLY